MNYDDTLEIIRKATAAGVIKWNLDFPRGRQPIIVPGIETHFFHFKATIGIRFVLQSAMGTWWQI